MTPEQEDAHWALMGKPLMRHWRELLAVRSRYKAGRTRCGAYSYADAADAWSRIVVKAGATSHYWLITGYKVDDIVYLFDDLT